MANTQTKAKTKLHAKANPPRGAYSDQFRASAVAAVAANGGDVAVAARQLGLPYRTLLDWAGGPDAPAAAPRAGLADELEGLAGRLVRVVTAKVHLLDAKEAAIALGITVDKLLLLRGRPAGVVRTPPPPTADTLHVLRLAEELLARLVRLRAETAALNAGPSAGPSAGPFPPAAAS